MSINDRNEEKDMKKEDLEKAIETIEYDNGWNFTGKGRHYGYRGYWFVDGEGFVHWISTWKVRKIAKEVK